MDRDTNHQILDWFSPELLIELIEELREAGYNIGISQHIAAHDLVLSLISQDTLSTPERLGSFLAPILCSSSVEQQDFHNWLELVETRNSLPLAEATKPDRKLEAELKQISNKSRKFKLALVAVSIVFPLLLWMGSPKSSQPTLDEPVVEEPVAEEPVAEEPVAEEPVAEEPVAEKPVAEKPVAEPTSNWQITLVFILLISGVGYFAWKKWWLRQANLFLQRRETTQTPRLEQISFSGLEESLFKPLLVLKTAQNLRHRIRVSTNTLDINKTIHDSLQNRGWFTPSYGYRQVFPEYLFLIDRVSVWDHQAEFVEQLTHQLKQSGVYITTYFFDEDPRVCFSSNKGIFPQTLTEISFKYQQHRLVIFADAEVFFNVHTAGYAPWVEQLFSWHNAVAITPKPLGNWGSNEFLLAQSLTLLPLSDTGIQVLGQVMQGDSAIYRASSEDSSVMPTMLKSRPKRWIERDPPKPEQAKAVLIGLRTYLGDDGFYWLAACAVFPQLRWHITLYLGHQLKTQARSSLLESCSLSNLARLPWYRYGYMPDWFRGYLIATLTQQQQTEVRLVLQQLLMTAISGSKSAYALEFARQDQSLLPRLTKPILRILSKQASENTAFKDYLFLDFMSGKSQLAVEIPQEIVPILRQYSQTDVSKRRKKRIRAWSLIILFSLVGTATAYYFIVIEVQLKDETKIELLHTLQGHQSGVSSVVFSPDGKYLATASNDGTARLWDLKSRQLVYTFQGHQSGVNSVVFSPDGSYLATASNDGTARLWGLKSRQLVYTFQGHQSGVNSVVFSPDGRYLATASNDGTARLWDIATRGLYTLQGHQSGVLSVVFSPDGKYLATASNDGTAKLWDVATGEPVYTLQGDQSGVLSVVFSPDGKSLATTSNDGTARIWKL